MKTQDPQPPRFFQQIFRWFCRPEFYEDIEGDLYERFHYMCDQQSVSAAKRYYMLEVVRLFRPGIIRGFMERQNSNTMAMLWTHLKIALRNIQRQRASFLINWIGLATGLASAILIFLWVQDERSVDQYHVKGERLYQVHSAANYESGLEVGDATPGPCGQALRDEVTGVEAVAMSSRIMHGIPLTVREVENRADGQWVQPDFLHLFTLPLVQGSMASALDDPGDLVISASLAKQMFPGTEDYLGQELSWNYGDTTFLFQVSGVMADVPPTTSQSFDFLGSWKVFEYMMGDNLNHWGNTGPVTYVLMQEHADVVQANAELKELTQEQLGDDFWLRMYHYPSLYLLNRFEGEVPVAGRLTYVRLFSFVAFFLVLMACINFMNLATAKATTRLKEIGVKKALGAGRTSLIVQHLAESVLMAVLALVLALVVVSVFLPEFNSITQKHLQWNYRGETFLVVLMITLFTGLVAGSYPALYLSKFQPLSILRGTLTRLGGDAWARKGLVVFQFFVTTVLLASVMVVYQQIRYTQTMDLGYQKDNLVRLRMEGRVKQDYTTFVEQVRQVPGVAHAAISNHSMLNHNSSTTGIGWPGKDPDFHMSTELYFAQPGLIETLGMTMVAGRSFDQDILADTARLIFNEKAIEVMGLEDPIGTVVHFWGEPKEIVGVVKNFNYATVHEDYSPAVFFVTPWNLQYVMVRTQAGRTREAISNLESLHAEFNPGYSLDYRFVDEEYQKLYYAEQQTASLAKYFAGIAMLISLLGLLGLVSFTADRRKKEIGIRKVLGSGRSRIVLLISREFSVLVGLGLLLALPISYYLGQWWLTSSFAFHIHLSFWQFALVGVAAMAFVWLVVGLQSSRAARLNPVKVLKDD